MTDIFGEKIEDLKENNTINELLTGDWGLTKDDKLYIAIAKIINEINARVEQSCAADYGNSYDEIDRMYRNFLRGLIIRIIDNK